MGKALEVIAGGATAPGANFAELVMGAGNSVNIRSFKPSSSAYIIAMWDWRNADGNFRVKSPLLHDYVQGIQVYGNAGEIYNYLPQGMVQKIASQDKLTLEIKGSAAAGQIEQAALFIYYEDLDGANARFINSNELRLRSKNIVVLENSLTPGVLGGWSGEAAIAGTYLKANTNYAVCGFTFSAACLAVGLRGADTSNLRLACPGEHNNKEMTANWFIRLSDTLGTSLIPVINSANISNTLLDVMQNQTGTAVKVSTILVELS